MVHIKINRGMVICLLQQQLVALSDEGDYEDDRMIIQPGSISGIMQVP